MLPSLALAVLPTAPQWVPLAESQGQQLGLEVLAPADPTAVDSVPMVLLVGEQGLSLQQTGPRAPGPVRVDFVGGALAHRRKYGGGAGQQIAKAVGIKGGIRPRVADVTAGLGRDAFVLATLGCEVALVERSPLIAALLADGLQRGRLDPEVAPILARMTLQQAQGQAYLASLTGTERAPQVVYLDPMFPHSSKTAAVKKEMRLFREVIGDDTDTGELLAAALACARNRVVVKRPRKAPTLAGPEPSFRIEGKSGRFDIYALKSLEVQR